MFSICSQRETCTLHPSIETIQPINYNAPLIDAPQKGDFAREAIVYAMEVLPDFEALNFLKDYLEDNLTPWPDYTDWLAARQVEGRTVDGHHQIQA